MFQSFPESVFQRNTMTLTGQGQVSVAPDTAVIRLGVQSTGDNLTTIQAENAEISQSILQALQQMGITDIKTFQYLIEKIYDYKDGTRIDRGYSVRNILEIRMSDMDDVGTVIDTAVNHGANIVDLIAFEVSDSDIYYQQALNLAVLNAFQKAQSISQRLGLSVDPIPTHIVENSTLPVPYPSYSSVRELNVTTPIESGKKRINALVTVEFVY